MGRKYAIVTTTRSPQKRIKSFVDYHRAIGFERFYLYFDDPSDPAIDVVRGAANVVTTPCTDELRRQWEEAPLWPIFSPWVATEVMARQILNACHAKTRARQDGIDWLFHLDDDELFHPADGSLDELFDEVEEAGAETVRFANLEAVVEALSVEDPFREATHFKRNPTLLTADEVQTLTRVMARRGRTAQGFFTAYLNGKSAVSTKSELVPHGVHGFASPRRSDADRRGEAVVDCFGPCFVLHYPNASLSSFTEKYRRLGRFPDTYFGTDPIPKGTFHVDARDTVMRGNEDETIRFYMERVVTPPDLLTELRRSGLVDRIEAPSRILRDGGA